VGCWDCVEGDGVGAGVGVGVVGQCRLWRLREHEDGWCRRNDSSAWGRCCSGRRWQLYDISEMAGAKSLSLSEKSSCLL